MLLMKRCLIILVFCIHALFSIAQQQTGIMFGLGSGINIAGIRAHNLQLPGSPQTLVGVRGVLFAEIPMAEGFSLQPEFSFDQLGWQYHGEDPYSAGQIADVSISMQYLFVTALPKYTFPQTNFSVYIGPGYGFLLGATLTGYNNHTQNVKDVYKSGDFVGVMGMDYFLSMGIGLSARFTTGLSNLINEAEQDESVHNYSISFTLCYKIQKRKMANAGAYPLNGR
jgi:outer membrane immunogenic protein